MGLIPDDRRPRDWAYMVRFDEKDLPSLQAMARHIRETHDTAMIEDFNLKCEQKLKTGVAELNNGIAIQSVTKTEDLVVNNGLQQCINIILGTSSVRWSHFGFGSNATSVTVTNTALLGETVATRVSLAWSEAVGMRLFFGGISSQTSGLMPTTAREIGVYNGSAAGAILLNRNGFGINSSPAQTIPSFADVASAPIVVSSVIEFCPVA